MLSSHVSSFPSSPRHMPSILSRIRFSIPTLSAFDARRFSSTFRQLTLSCFPPVTFLRGEKKNCEHEYEIGRIRTSNIELNRGDIHLYTLWGPLYLVYVFFILFFFLPHFYFPASGKAVATGVVPSPPRFLPSILPRIGFSNLTARRFFIECISYTAVTTACKSTGSRYFLAHFFYLVRVLLLLLPSYNTQLRPGVTT